MGFNEDLKFGKKGELFILPILQKHYPLARKSEVLEYDLYIPETDKKVEVKTDRGSKESPNIVVEVSCGGKDSGVRGVSDLWAQIFYSHRQREWVYFITKTKKMHSFSILRGVHVPGGDDNKSDLLKIRKVLVEREFKDKLRSCKKGAK